MKKYLMALMVLIIAGCAMMAQVPAAPTPAEVIVGLKNATDWAEMLTYYDAIIVVLITLGGYVSYLIPGFNWITDTRARVIAFGILCIAAVVLLGFANVWQGILLFFISSGIYSSLLKMVVPTPKANEVKSN